VPLFMRHNQEVCRHPDKPDFLCSESTALRLFRTKCYDKTPEHPWKARRPLARNRFRQELMAKRLAMAIWFKADTTIANKHHMQTFVIQFDPISQIISKQRVDEISCPISQHLIFRSDDCADENEHVRFKQFSNSEIRLEII
jgi:hypothetical protein